MKKRLLFIFLILLMLGTIAYFYIYNIFLPVKLKEIIANQSETLINRKINVGDITYKFGKGFTINDITVFDLSSSNKPFIQIKSISFNVILTSLIKNKSVIIPSINLEDSELYLLRDNEGFWNFDDLIKSQEKKSSSEYSIIVTKISTRNSSLYISDQYHKNNFVETINKLNMDARLDLTKSISFNINGKLPQHDGMIEIIGKYQLADKKFIGKANLKNIPIQKYLSLTEFATTINVNNALIEECGTSVEASSNFINISGGTKIANIDYQHENTSLHALYLIVSEAHLNMNDNQITFAGLVNLPNTSLTNQEISLSSSLNAQITQSTIKGSDVHVEGSFSGKQLDIKSGDSLSIQGEISSENFIFAQKADVQQIRGSFQLNNGHINAGGNSLVGNLILNQTDASFNNNQISGTSNISMNNAAVQLQDGSILKGDITLDHFNLNHQPQQTVIKSNLDISQTDITAGNGQHFSGHILTKNLSLILNNQAITAAASVDLLDTEYSITKNTFFKGSPNLTFTFSHTPSSTDQIRSATDYSGQIVLKNAEINGLDQVDEIGAISGLLNFSNDLVSTKNLNFTMLLSDFSLNGELKKFKNPHLSAQISSDSINLAEATTLAKSFTSMENISLSGFSSLSLSFNGAIDAPKDANISAEVALKDTSFSIPNTQEEISQLTGSISYANQTVVWKNVRGNFRDNSFQTNGDFSFLNLNRPALNATITSSDVNVSTAVKFIHRDIFDIESFNAVFKNSRIQGLGKIILVPNESPLIEFKGPFSMTLTDFSSLSPQIKDILTKNQISGNLTGDMVFKGQPTKWEDWSLAITAQSPSFKIYDLPFKETNIEYAQRDRYINKVNILSSIYNGRFTLNGKIDLSTKDLNMQFDSAIENIDLAELRKDRKIVKRQFAGNLNAKATVKGPLNNQNNITGQGSASVENGYLWQLIPQYKDIVFTNLKSTFTIANRQIFTKDLKLYSQMIILTGQGWVDFNRDISFDVTPSPVLTANGQKIDPSSLFAQVARIKCSGPITKPSCTPEISPFKIFKNTTGILKDGIGTILEGILSQ